MNLVELIGVFSEWGPSQSPFENEEEVFRLWSIIIENKKERKKVALGALSIIITF